MNHIWPRKRFCVPRLTVGLQVGTKAKMTKELSLTLTAGESAKAPDPGFCGPRSSRHSWGPNVESFRTTTKNVQDRPGILEDITNTTVLVIDGIGEPRSWHGIAAVPRARRCPSAPRCIVGAKSETPLTRQILHGETYQKHRTWVKIERMQNCGRDSGGGVSGGNYTAGRGPDSAHA